MDGVTKEEIEEWLEMMRHNYERPYRYICHLFEKELKRRRNAGQKTSPVPLKERNSIAVALYRKNKRKDAEEQVEADRIAEYGKGVRRALDKKFGR